MLEEKPSDVLKQDKLTYSNRNPNNFSSPKNDYELNFLVSSYKQYGVVPSGSLPSLSPYVGKLDTDANSMFNSGNMMMDVSSSEGRPENFYPELFDQT